MRWLRTALAALTCTACAIGFPLCQDVAEATTACAVYPDNECGVCPCDCNRDGHVAVNEIVRGIQIANGWDTVDSCESADRDGDGLVEIEDLVAAVRTSLDRCPRYPSVPDPGSVSFIVSWLVYDDAPDLVDPWSWPEPPVNRFNVYAQRIRAGDPRYTRGTPPGHILIVAVDADGREIAHSIDYDPRWVYFDCLDPRMDPICGGAYFRSNAALSVSLPYEPAITELRIFEIGGTWGDIELDFLGVVAVSIE